MGSSACSSNDDFEALGDSGLGEGSHAVGSSVSGCDGNVIGDVES